MVVLTVGYEFVIGGDPDRDTVDIAVVEAAPVGCAAAPPTVMRDR
ncbi:MAG TPA: hypothetical protein VFP34_12420 [Microlunatus sp.]|nr:hypothetical protein [Microlunatus sp.]